MNNRALDDAAPRRIDRHPKHRARVAFQHALADAALQIPHTNRLIAGGADGAAPVGVADHGVEIRRVPQRHAPQQHVVATVTVQRRRRLARADERLELVIVALTPVDIPKLHKRPAHRGIVEPQRDEPALPVQRIAKATRLTLKRRPIRTQRMLRHAQHEHSAALQARLDPGWDRIPGLDLPIVQPDPQAAVAQSTRQRMYDGLVARAVAQKDIMRMGHATIIACHRPPAMRDSSIPRRPVRNIGNRGRDRPWSFRVGAAPRADPNVRV